MALTPTKVLSTLAKLQPLLSMGDLGSLTIKLLDYTGDKEHPCWRVQAYVWGYSSYRIDVCQDTTEEDFKEVYMDLRNELKARKSYKL